MTNRDSHTVAIPVSVVKIARSDAWRSTATATASGRIRSSGLSNTVRTFSITPRAS